MTARRSATAGTTPLAPPPGLSARRRWIVLAVCAFALFLVGLDTTIVVVGLPAIGAGLDVEPASLAWVVDAYTVPLASLLITSGALADRFGRRRVFQLGLITFGVASIVCAAAPSIELLIAARVLQGVGASMLTPVALSIVVNVMTDRRERALAIGLWGAMFGLSMAAGPVTGGALLTHFGWNALFWINAPVVVLALVLTATLVPESRAAVPRAIDLPGQLLVILLVATSVAVLIEGPRIGWGAPPLIAAYAVLLAAGVALVVVESRRAAPLLEPALFAVPSFSAAVIGAVAVFIAFSMTLLLTTSLLQRGLGWTALAAGAATLPMAVMATVCAPASGLLVGRVGPRLPLILASICLIAGGSLLAGLAAGFSFPLLLAAFLLIGTGVGFANAPITNTAVGGLSPERAGVASGVTSTARQLGTAIGIALAGSLNAAVQHTGAAHASVQAAAAEHTGNSALAMLPGWIGIAACGVVLLASAAAAPGRVRG